GWGALPAGLGRPLLPLYLGHELRGAAGERLLLTLRGGHALRGQGLAARHRGLRLQGAGAGVRHRRAGALAAVAACREAHEGIRRGALGHARAACRPIPGLLRALRADRQHLPHLTQRQGRALHPGVGRAAAVG
ncbi:unnamed protein product, partial [Effrenium voratum]